MFPMTKKCATVGGAGTMAMRSQIRPLVAGNWKMNGLTSALGEARRVCEGLAQHDFAAGADAMLCPPATLLAGLSQVAAGSRLLLAGQDCHAAANGAHNGDLSAEMLKDAGASAVIVGHSERRAGHGERSCDVMAKAEAAYRAGLAAIICLGETAGERLSNLTLAVVGRQLAGSVPPAATAQNTIIAYEPVWAIGTGLTASPGDVAQVHAFLRRALGERFGAAGAAMRLLYGGSVKPDNARALLQVGDVNGALVGGASLKADDFLAIVEAWGA
jgi:triosephosphate isomerase